jgi:glycosyltransferase involved in cell wall biosynthesis
MTLQHQSVAILEWCGSGHRLTYVASTFDGLLGRGVQVSLYTTKRMESDYGGQLAVHLGSRISTGLRVVSVPAFDEESFLRRVRGMYWILRDISRNGVLSVPDGDRWMVPIILVSPIILYKRILLRLVVMHPFLESPGWRSRIRIRLKSSIARVCQFLCGEASVGVLVPPQGVRHGQLRIWRNMRLVGDTEFRGNRFHPREAKNHFLFPEGEVVLGIFGVMSSRKNPELVMDAAIRVASILKAKVRVFAPGLVDIGLKRQLEQHEVGSQVTLDIRNTTLSEDHYHLAIQSADVVLALHSNPGSSGVVTEAAALGIPVVASRVEGLSFQVESMGAGICVELKASAVAEAISQLVRSSNRFPSRFVQEGLIPPHSDVSKYLAGAE